MPHIHEKYDFVVSVYIVHEGKVLMVYHPSYGKWLPPGGHIELNEDPEEALLREIKEETGLEVTILGNKPPINSDEDKFLFRPQFLSTYNANSPHKHIDLCYFAVAKDKNNQISSEHDTARWLGLEDLEKDEFGLKQSIIFFCREAIKATSSSTS